MYNEYKFTYANINKSAFQNELSRRGAYYANVVMWTTLFSLPLFFLLDYLFLKDKWVDLILIRLIGFGLSYIVYTFFTKKKWGYLKTLTWFVGINIIIHSIICGIVPSLQAFPYFILISIFVLVIHTTVFWNTNNSIALIITSFVVILFFYSFKTRVDKYNILIENGGGVYFLLACFSLLLVYTRYNILGRDIERTVILEETHNKLLDQTVKIKDQEVKIEDSNRKLKSLDEFKTETDSTLSNELKNLSSTIQSTVDTIKNQDNLTNSQLESLNTITEQNQRIEQVTQKISSTSNQAKEVYFNKAYFDLNPEAERAVIELIDSIHLKNQSIQLNISPSPNNIYQEKIIVEQVLNKILTHIIRYSPSGSILTLRAERQNDRGIVELTSHASSVSGEKLEEIMKKLSNISFNDGIQAKEVGLESTKQQIEDMGGTFYFSRTDDNSNYLKIELPSTQ